MKSNLIEPHGTCSSYICWPPGTSQRANTKSPAHLQVVWLDLVSCRSESLGTCTCKKDALTQRTFECLWPGQNLKCLDQLSNAMSVAKFELCKLLQTPSQWVCFANFCNQLGQRWLQNVSNGFKQWLIVMTINGCDSWLWMDMNFKVIDGWTNIVDWFTNHYLMLNGSQWLIYAYRRFAPPRPRRAVIGCNGLWLDLKRQVPKNDEHKLWVMITSNILIVTNN